MPGVSPVYEFGEFRFDAGQHLLFRGDAVVPLLPKVADTLQVLLDQHGAVVDKSEMMRLIWPDTTVEDIGLARNISLLRKALGDDAGSDRFIETIPRRGYRFVGEVRVLGEDGSPPASRPPSHSPRLWWAIAIVVATALSWTVYWQFYRSSRFAAGGTGYANVAVVPFTCLSPEIGCGAFSTSFEELLSARLAGRPGVNVISPATVERYRRARISPSWMGRLLGLEVLLEGTAQRAGDRVRITARLGDVHSGKLIWAEVYECSAADLPREEAAVAEAIAAKVGERLTASR